MVQKTDEEWQKSYEALMNIEAKHVGRTSAACLSAALRLSQTVKDRVFVILFYDPAWKYLDIG